MPNRLIREGILDSTAVNSLSLEAEVFYRRLLNIIDDYGRFDGRPAVLRARLYAMKLDVVEERNIAEWLSDCVRAGLVVCYEVGGKPFLEVLRFNQQIRAKNSKWPAPPVQGTCSATTLPVTSTCETCDIQVRTKSKSKSKSKAKATEDSSEPTSSASEQHSCDERKANTTNLGEQKPVELPSLTFPVVGDAALKEWHLVASHIGALSEAYPNVDILSEARKALAWINANPTKRKTARCMPKFLNSWISRANNAGTAARPNNPSKAQPASNFAVDLAKSGETAPPMVLPNRKEIP